MNGAKGCSVADMVSDGNRSLDIEYETDKAEIHLKK